MSLIGRLFNELEQAHAQRVGVGANPRHGRYAGVDSREIDFVADDPLVVQEEPLVPVAGPSFVHDLGADLRLEID